MMSETLEERIRRHAIENRDELVGFYARDIVEILDTRDVDHAALIAAAREVVRVRRTKHGVNLITLTDRIDDLAARLPCQHDASVTMHTRYDPGTRREPADSEQYAICNTCGKKIDRADVPNSAEIMDTDGRIERRAAEGATDGKE